MLNYFKTILIYYIILARNIKRFVKIKRGAKLSLKTIFEGNNFVGTKTNVINTNMGFGSYIADNSKLAHASIGRFCSIGSEVSVIIGAHPVRKFVSTHPAFFSTKKIMGLSFVPFDKYEEIKYAEKASKKIIKIENDVWIGNNVKIMQGITIKNGAIIAAGSLITKDVEEYSIVGGVPGKEIRKRFTLQQIDLLRSIKWWDWSPDKIKKYAYTFEDIDTFLLNKS